MQIKELILYTNSLGKLKDFYYETLGMNVIQESETSITLQSRLTNITFNLSNNLKDSFYHFAFNIPENQFREAKDWAKQRVELIKLKNEDEFDFKSWNAHSVYFYDPAGNIIELIARHNLKNSSQNIFTGNSLLGVSEIGCPVHKVKEFYEILNDTFNIPSFSGDMKTFTAAGNDDGLFIIVPQRRKWFPDCPEARIFPMTVKIISEEVNELKLKDLPYKIISVLE